MSNSLERFLLIFNPSQWSAGRRLWYLIGPPLKVTGAVQAGIQSASGHLDRFAVFATIAERTIPELANEEAELEEQGFTSAQNSRELAALFEAMYSELYSSLDGLRSLLHALYPKVQGVPSKSVERLFKRASDNTFGAEFPEPIRKALADAYGTWFPHLRRVRRKTVHGSTGNCSLDSETETLQYSHHDFESPKPDVLIDDVVADVKRIHASVKALHEAVFDHLYSQLSSEERCVPCGFYRGRLYERFVLPEADLSMDSGRCYSLKWFEESSETMCPLASRCGAYTLAKEERIDA